VCTLTQMLMVTLACTAALSACASNAKRPQPVIIADGTEVQQFANIAMCGDIEKFVSALAPVGKHLGRKWDEVLGEDNREECSIRLSVDESGHIRSRELVRCENSAALDRVLAAADPVPVPADPCLLDRLNGVTISLNSKVPAE
jgi:hypothetical protein